MIYPTFRRDASGLKCASGLFAAFAFFICLTFAQTAAAQQTFTVDNNSDNGALSACTATANDCSLRGAFNNANASAAPDMINFAIPSASCASGVCTIILTNGPLSMNDAAVAGALTIINSTGASNLRISGNNATRVFTVGMGGNLTLNGLTVTNGFGDGANTDGSGIYIFQGTLSLINSAVSGNGNATLNHGGGIYNNQGTLSLTNSTVSGNTVGNNGGGIYNETGTVTLTNSTVSGNRGNFGGGIINSGGTLSLTNSTVSGNTASQGGGGIRNDGGTFNLTSVTIAFNTANNGGGVSSLFSSATLLNTIVARNTGGFDYDGGITAGSSSNLIGTDPRLAPLGNYGGQTFTHALLSGSPAIDAGNGALAGTPTTDQRGAARSGATDIGAFEVNASFVAVLPSGTVNIPYYQLITSDNGTATYMVVSGTLPPGLTLTGGIQPNLNSGKASHSDLTSAFAPQAVIAIQGTPTIGGTFDFALEVSEGGNTNVTNYRIVIAAAPTAANVSIGGRVSANGRGLRNAVVQITDAQGNTRTARTGSFGYYRFDEVESGETYTIAVNSKRFQFDSQVISVSDNISDLDFTAIP